MIAISRPKRIFALSLSLLAAREPGAAASPIAFQDGRLSARIENRPLTEVLRELAAATGARFALSDPGTGQATVSAAVESQGFLEGVKTILEGFSYAIYPMDGRGLPAVLVLSTPPVQRSSGVSGATRQRPAGGEPRAAPVPTVLGQEAAAEAGQAQALARGQAEREETLNHAMAALSATDGQLSQRALGQLVGIRDDPRATEALIRAASGTQDSRARAQATEALWDHAADLEFADEASVSTLEQLATDADAEVQEIAKQALADMKQFREAKAAQSPE